MKSGKISNLGLLIAIVIVLFWLSSTVFLMLYPINQGIYFTILFILIQTHLYTGIFITAHDAMHGTICKNKTINYLTGFVCSLIFAFNWYPKLLSKHHLHHKYPATDKDPDFAAGNFIQWYFKFLKEYITIPQLVLMAVTYNILKLYFDELNVVLFWMMPSLLSTLQLFYFGTFLPHRGLHEDFNVHKARSQRKNHVWAFISCYFFGYHYEHHSNPGLPWWQLYKKRK